MAIATIERTTLTEQLREDHRRMKDMFSEFETAGTEDRKSIVRDFLPLIETHDLIEKEVLYPSALETSDVSRELVLRCKEAHHVVNVVLAELKVMPYSERYFAKFSQLASAIRDHIREEEAELFPALERSELDLDELGMEARKIRMAGARRGRLGPISSGTGAFLTAATVAAVGWMIYDAYRSGARRSK